MDYVADDEQGDELKLLIELIETFGAPQILDALARAGTEDEADVVISTAHKSKGREWDSVTLAADYPPPRSENDSQPDELRLLYVATTRARRHLDTSRVPHATRQPAPRPARART